MGVQQMNFAETQGKDVVCKAAVAWGPKQPLELVNVKVQAPKAGEVKFLIEYYYLLIISNMY